MRFQQYEVGEFFDELFGENGAPRASARTLVNNIESLPEGELINRQRAAERALLQMGITFNVYGESAGTEKIFPFDLVPRILPAAEWSRIDRGRLSGTAAPAASAGRAHNIFTSGGLTAETQRFPRVTAATPAGRW